MVVLGREKAVQLTGPEWIFFNSNRHTTVVWRAVQRHLSPTGNSRQEGFLRPLLKRHVRHVMFADVDLLRAENAVVLQLLQPVGQPTGDARDGEDRREKVAREAQTLVDEAGV